MSAQQKNDIPGLKTRSFVTGARRLAAGMAALLLSLGSMDAQAKDGSVATAAIIDSLDPHKTSGSAAALFIHNVYDTLINLNVTPSDKRGRHVPGLASSWTVSEAGRIIEFNLRPNILFQSGKPLTAEDVKFSFDRILKPEIRNPYRSNHFSYVASVDVISPDKVQFRLKEPFAGMLDAIAAYGFVVSKEYVTQIGDAEFDKKPMGSGPYSVASYRQGDRMLFKAFEKHWAGKPYFDNLLWRAVPDINTRIAMLASGEADAITDVPEGLMQIVRGNGAIAKVLLGQNQRFLIINTLRGGPLADRRVRLALNMAIDRKALVQALFNDDVPMMNGPLSSYHVAGDSVGPYPFDLAQAKKLMAEAGYRNGFTVDLIYTPGRYLDDPEMLPILISYWKPLGVQINLKATEYNQWIDLPKTKQYSGMISFSKGAGVVADPISAFSRHIACDGLYSGYCNKEVDELVNSANQIVDEAKLKEIFGKAQRIAHDDAAQIFLFDQPSIMAWRKGLKWNSEYGGADLTGSWALLTQE